MALRHGDAFVGRGDNTLADICARVRLDISKVSTVRYTLLDRPRRCTCAPTRPKLCARRQETFGLRPAGGARWLVRGAAAIVGGMRLSELSAVTDIAPSISHHHACVESCPNPDNRPANRASNLRRSVRQAQAQNMQRRGSGKGAQGKR